MNEEYISTTSGTILVPRFLQVFWSCHDEHSISEAWLDWSDNIHEWNMKNQGLETFADNLVFSYRSNIDVHTSSQLCTAEQRTRENYLIVMLFNCSFILAVEETQAPTSMISEFKSLLEKRSAPNICQFNRSMYKVPPNIDVSIDSPLGPS